MFVHFWEDGFQIFNAIAGGSNRHDGGFVAKNQSFSFESQVFTVENSPPVIFRKKFFRHEVFWWILDQIDHW